MPHVTIGKEYKFEAAHHLPNHRGKCAALHGHSYKVGVCLTGPTWANPGASDDRMVMDFGDLDAIVKPVIDALDHSDLNDPEGYAQKQLELGRPTAEALAVALATVFAAMISLHGPVTVRVWETSKAWAEYSTSA